MSRYLPNWLVVSASYICWITILLGIAGFVLLATLSVYSVGSPWGQYVVFALTCLFFTWGAIAALIAKNYAPAGSSSQPAIVDVDFSFVDCLERVRKYAHLIPPAAAWKMNVLPIYGEPSCQDRFRYTCAYVDLLCREELTAQQQEELHFMIPFCSFEFLWPGHSGVRKSEEILLAQFQHALELLYPPEEDDCIEMNES